MSASCSRLGQQRSQRGGVRCQAGKAHAQALPAVPREPQQQQLSGPSKLAVGLLGAAAALSLALAPPPALAAEPFLKSTGEQARRGGATSNLIKPSLPGWQNRGGGGQHPQHHRVAPTPRQCLHRRRGCHRVC